MNSGEKQQGVTTGPAEQAKAEEKLAAGGPPATEDAEAGGWLGGQAGGYRLYLWLIVPVLLLVGVVVATVYRAPSVKAPDGTNRTEKEDSPLVEARQALSESHGLAACKTALSSFNSYLRAELAPELAKLDEFAENAAPRMADRLAVSGEGEEAQKLRELALAELKSAEFTGLDAYHLETCLLLRDVAESLEVSAGGGERESPLRFTPLERARAAFDWVCRQVRLAPRDGFAFTAPVQFVLRRGYGSEFERALVFCALLEQVQPEDNTGRLRGCLLTLSVPGGRRLWACGVAVGDAPKDLYLFDPRMGLPVPGPKGKGIATLAQARSDATVLGQLKAGKLDYAVTREQAAKAEARVPYQWSALAPRMLLLQDRLLRMPKWKGRPLPAPAVVRLALPAGDTAPAYPNLEKALGPIKAAVKNGGGDPESVLFQLGDAGLALGLSLPRREGGIERAERFQWGQLPGFVSGAAQNDVSQQPRWQLLLLRAAPWQRFPEELRGPSSRLPHDVGAGWALRMWFANQFALGREGHESPREMVLRGKADDTTSRQLTERLKIWRPLIAADGGKRAAEMEKGLEKARALDERLRQAGKGGEDGQALNKEINELGAELLGVAVARPLAADAAYQLGLCKHERAMRLEMCYRLAKRGGVDRPDEKKRADREWQAAADAWRDCVRIYPEGPSAAMARRLRVEALQYLGGREAAERAWGEPGNHGTPLEQVGEKWLADHPGAWLASE